MSSQTLQFSLHASDVMQERGISSDWVQRVFEDPVATFPDLTDPDLVHVLAPITERDGRVLRVVYNRRVEPVLVVTAFFDRAMRGKL
jgi:hypothetical protein